MGWIRIIRKSKDALNCLSGKGIELRAFLVWSMEGFIRKLEILAQVT